MVRTVKTPVVLSRNKGARAVLLPGSTDAEPWEVWMMGPSAPVRRVQFCRTPRENPLRKNATLALPASQVYCLPLWLNETDSKQFAGMIPLQLELRGLQPRGAGGAVFDWTVAAREGARTLILTGVLPSSLATDVQAEDYGDFDLGLRFLTFAEDAMTLWREENRLVVAFTRGLNLVYYQALGQGTITPQTIQDLNCIRASLALQGYLADLTQVVLWTEADSGDIALLEAGLRLPARQANRPPPKAPSPGWNLMPPSVGEAKRTREVQRWRRRGLAIASIVYFLVVGALLSRYVATSFKIDQLSKWQSDHAQAIAQVRDTRAAWTELRPVVDTNSYPLELLLHISEAIPTDQLHLTLFESSDDGHLLIKGEAKNASAAFQFLDKLKTNPHLSGYTFETGQPHLLPNDLAQLQIEGTRATAN